MANSPIDQLQKLTGKEWETIKLAENNSIKEKERIAEILYVNGTKIIDSDCDFVVFGSLARNEFTSGSDLDWTLLIDGVSKPDHQNTVVDLRNKLRESGYNDPGTTGTFGGMAFSHDMIHHIGGFEDGNKNTTRRLLLLLESFPVSKQNNSVVYKNVIKNILTRYLNKSFTTGDLKFPRFLLNDIVRYWRLICVDFAAKEWEEREHKWVLRNIKLRFSRKLLFVAGMLMCYSFNENGKNNLDQDSKLEDVINEFVFKTPLEILAAFLVKHQLKEIAEDLFDSYDYFLSVLNNESKRKHLEGLSPKDINEDKTYQNLRKRGHIYQNSLTKMFFEGETSLRDFTIKYGVF